MLKSVQDAKRAAQLHQAGAYAEAASLYAGVLKLDPQNAQTRYMLALCLMRLRRWPEAAAALRTAASQLPKDANIAASLGEVLLKMGQTAEAEQAYRHACALQPNHPAARRALARIIAARPDGLAILRQRVEEDPGDGSATLALGRAMIAAGEDPELAIAVWLEAEKRGAITSDDLTSEADIAHLDAQQEQALPLLRAAAVLLPKHAGIRCNIGALEMDRSLERAARALEAALAIDPNHLSALMNMATLLTRIKKHSEALNYYLRALTVAPDSMAAYAGAIDMSRHICEWGKLEQWEAELRQLLAKQEPMGVDPFVLLNCHVSPRDLLRTARSQARNRIIRGAPLPPAAPREPNGRIRIGYLSNDLRAHATAYLAVGMFEHHDRERLEIFAYSHAAEDGSQIRRRIVDAFDHFTDVSTLTDRQVAQRIRDDGIDILVDLKGYTGGSRSAIMALRPAPVQVNFLGFPGTMGADFIDYIIGDPIITPLQAAADFDEKIVQLPDCYQPNDSRRVLPTTIPSRTECALPDEGFVFCCFNNTYKITPAMFAIWMRLLDQVPGSVLWLFEANRTVRDNLAYETASRGVDPDRLVFAPFEADQAKHIARYGQADLFLDTLPVNAHTTASDALWAGVPVVTCPGESFVSRVAASLLHAVGLPELVAPSLEAYEALALSLAQDPQRLTALKAHLAAVRASAPLFDTATYTRNLDTAYLRMHALHHAGKPPEAIVV